jgi:hypothetical protein
MDEAIPPEELMKLRKIVKVLTAPLINAVRALWMARGAILHPNGPSMSRLLIPTRRPEGSSKRAAQKPDQNYSIDEYTVTTDLPPINRSKHKHTPQSSDPPPTKTREAPQSYLTTYTSSTGKRKPPTDVSSSFRTLERPRTGSAISTANCIHRTPAAPHFL